MSTPVNIGYAVLEARVRKRIETKAALRRSGYGALADFVTGATDDAVIDDIIELLAESS